MPGTPLPTPAAAKQAAAVLQAALQAPFLALWGCSPVGSNGTALPSRVVCEPGLIPPDIAPALSVQACWLAGANGSSSGTGAPALSSCSIPSSTVAMAALSQVGPTGIALLVRAYPAPPSDDAFSQLGGALQ